MKKTSIILSLLILSIGSYAQEVSDSTLAALKQQLKAEILEDIKNETKREVNEDSIQVKKEKEKKKGKIFTAQLHGTLRGKYEYEPDINKSRFEVRNARLSVSGSVTPIVDYNLEIDLSDEGEIKMKNAYTKIKPFHGFYFQIGMFRIPFTIDAHRSPHQQYFANRSFIAKQVGNVRDIGAMIGYSFWESRPITVQACIFNGNGASLQKQWHNELNYSAKAQWLFAKGWNITLSTQGVTPSLDTKARLEMYDAGLYWENKNWHLEGEYIYKHYEDDLFNDCNAVDAFASYFLPIKKGIFHGISFLGRYDMMQDHSNGKTLQDDGKLKITDYGRHRATAGITLSFGYKMFVSDIRLNYEKYFYKSGVTPDESQQDKLVFEVMTRF